MVSPVFGGHGSRCAETFGRAVTRPSKLFAHSLLSIHHSPFANHHPPSLWLNMP
jgi:hypothetical protein